MRDIIKNKFSSLLNHIHFYLLNILFFHHHSSSLNTVFPADIFVILLNFRTLLHVFLYGFSLQPSTLSLRCSLSFPSDVIVCVHLCALSLSLSLSLLYTTFHLSLSLYLCRADLTGRLQCAKCSESLAELFTEWDPPECLCPPPPSLYTSLSVSCHLLLTAFSNLRDFDTVTDFSCRVEHYLATDLTD